LYNHYYEAIGWSVHVYVILTIMDVENITVAKRRHPE